MHVVFAADDVAFFVWLETQLLQWRRGCWPSTLWSVLRFFAEKIFEQAFHLVEGLS